MGAPVRRRLLQSSLVVLTLLDLQLLASFVFNQWFDLSLANAMGLAAVLAIPLTLLLLPLVDAILAGLDRDLDGGFSGGKIPGAGQRALSRRSEERRVGKECVSRFKSGWAT